MSCKKGGKTKKHLLLAKLAADDIGSCSFCNRNIDDETIYGKLYVIGDIYCHYFCVLLSCCLIQKGKDNEGLFGFLYPDIAAEIERSKKHKCSYCGKEGATLGCSVTQCRKQFHLPCGREKDAVSLFYGNYKSFCQLHAPRQKINSEIMTKVRERTLGQRKSKVKETAIVEENTEINHVNDTQVCVICYEAVDAGPSVNTFWPPCCARDAWFHRNCLQRMALSAGIHYLKCPLCNDKEIFLQSVITQGYYVPDRDASWELEVGAFSEMYDRVISCNAAQCRCPQGRGHDSDNNGSWEIKLCILCGSSGMHEICMRTDACNNCDDNCSNCISNKNSRYICTICAPAAPEDIELLAKTIETVVVGEVTHPPAVRRGPAMPCRMSLRRTKGIYNRPSSSNTFNLKRIDTNNEDDKDGADKINLARMELNLKPPKRPYSFIKPDLLNNIDKTLISPLKLLENGLYEKITEIEHFELDSKIIDLMYEKFRKPKPLIVKKKIINDLVENVLEDLKKDKIKSTECEKLISPKKNIEIDIQKEEKEDSLTVDFKGFDINEANTVNFERNMQIIENLEKEDSDIKDVEVFLTPKKLKPVHIQKNSTMEISENNQTVKIDVKNDENPIENIKKVEKNIKEQCAFKFNPNKEELQTEMQNIDIESFKNHYLNEVGKVRKRIDNIKEIKTAMKRKLPRKETITKKKRKINKEIDLDSSIKRKKMKKRKKLSIKNKDIKIKIKFKHERLKLRITESSRKKKIQKMKKLKQYVLKFSPEKSRQILEKPKEKIPIKKRNIKTEKTPDKLIQTSLYDFFKKNDKKAA
ncbi:PREDICTED: uncharacterized protein LOC106108145 [Papilio polytes]|uniref:uncharacterized protein LOC106108145 n=1 Tax=Papilio polytes TaxID=76194 RepID=UPI0006763747|nr:PREDICTED: uncharacterized protein LOC106108145 [Papilio polytes]